MWRTSHIIWLQNTLKHKRVTPGVEGIFKHFKGSFLILRIQIITIVLVAASFICVATAS